MMAIEKGVWRVQEYQENVWYIFFGFETRAQIMCQTEKMANKVCELLNTYKVKGT